MLLVLGLLACAGKDNTGDSATGDSTPVVDPDGDGFLPPEDCDDTRADVFPGAEDANGDGVDADCDGVDGVPFVGCTPVDVPDVYPTIEDALVAGDTNICLGEGTFTPAALPEGAERAPSGFHGQGRDRTFLVDPARYYAPSVLGGLSATGIVTGNASHSFADVTLTDAVVEGFSNFQCDRCALVDSPIEMYVNEATRAVTLVDSWVTASDVGVHLVTEGCTASCGLYSDLRVNNMTFSGNGTAFAMDLRGNYNIYFQVENSVFVDQTENVLTVELHTGTGSPAVVPSGNGNLVWNCGEDPFPDGDAFTTQEHDPELDMAYAPPRPLPDSPVIDSAGSEASATDFWGNPRKVPDKGAVER
jgi:hypothetical protein